MWKKEKENRYSTLTKFTLINFTFNPKYHKNTNKLQDPSSRRLSLPLIKMQDLT